jgi:hypothetical protein
VTRCILENHLERPIPPWLKRLMESAGRARGPLSGAPE